LRGRAWGEGEKCIIPMIDISYDDASLLSDLSERTVEISGAGKTMKKNAESIIAKIEGNGKTNETIVLMGHLDSVPFSPGSSDNSAGVAILAELASIFKSARLKRNIVICFFSAEEWGLWGSRYFVASNESMLKNIIFGLNIDVAGDKLGINHAIITGNSDIVSLVKANAKYLGIGMNVSKDIYSSDNMPFSYKGIPTINLFRAGGKPSAYVHTCDDSFEYIDIKGLEPLINFSVEFLRSAGNAEINIIERSIDENIRQKIDDYFTGRGLDKESILPSLKKKKKK